MKNKLMRWYAVLPVLAVVGIAGTNIASAHGFFGNGFGNTATPDQIAERQQTMFQNEANLLGVSMDDVKNAWARGKSPQQLMAEKGINPSEVQTRILNTRLQQLKTQLQTLVSKGIITQAQSDQRLQTVQVKTQNAEGGHMRGMMGFHGGFGF